MSIIHRNSVFAQVLGAALVVLALGVWSAGCTLGDCETGEREICVGDDCTCGAACATDNACDKQDTQLNYIERCIAYEFTPEHGVCVSTDFMKKHKNATPDNPYGRHLAIPGEPPEEL